MKQTEQVLKKFLEYVEQAESFAKEHVPDYITQLLQYEAWDHALAMKMHACLMVVAFVFGVACAVLFCVALKRGMDGPDVFGVFGVIGALIFFGVFGWNTFDHYRAIKKIEMAPKVYILDYLRSKT